MTKEKAIQQGVELNQKYTSYIMDEKKYVRDYEIMQVEEHDFCSYWKMIEINEYLKKVELELIDFDTKEVLHTTKDFYTIPIEHLQKEIISTCTDCFSRKFILYIK